jgi:hypothetical protein
MNVSVYNGGAKQRGPKQPASPKRRNIEEMLIGRILIILGLITVLVGVVWLYFPRALSWFGHLPGDIRIEREGFSLFLPITSMIVLSLVATAVINGILWLLDRFG